MDSKSLIKIILDELGQSIGIPEFTFYDEKPTLLVFDDQVIVNFQLDKDSPYLIIFSSLGSVPNDLRLDVYQKLLKANLFWKNTAGATLGITEQDDIIMACKIPISTLDSRALESILVTFVNKAKELIDLLDGPVTTKTAGSKAIDSELTLSSQFLRI